MSSVGRSILRLLLSLSGVVAITASAFYAIPHNPTTVGFAYLLLVLLIASTWGLLEATLSALAATLTFNFFFLPPVGRLTIADPQNWVALFSFLATALIASRLSADAKRQALDAVERQRDIERLYTFSRAILLIDPVEPVAKQLARKLAEVFALDAVVLFERRSGEMHRAGPADFDGSEDQLRDAASQGTSYFDPERKRVITAVRLGSEPIASFAIQGPFMQDSVLQGISNLIAIGLERARAQDLAHQVEAARRSDQLRTTLIDAMAHEFKTPLTSIRAATTSLLSSPDQPAASRTELLEVADEEARHLQSLIDDAVDMARLESNHIQIRREPTDPRDLMQDVVASLQTQIDHRPVEIRADQPLPLVALDRRLLKLALKQVLDNALKYSPPRSPVDVHVSNGKDGVKFEITDHGPGIPPQEQSRLFERFYRSPSIKNQIPGFGLGLAIANNIVQAHQGEITVNSRPGETTFRVSLPAAAAADGAGARQ
ncbi:MAG TPA: ATP-binding protein [Bryobacteraceae bacterium]|nr:ATP-binding protein [Bryobacteraceae bacterium]